MDMTEKTVSSRYEFRGRIFNTRVDRVQLPDGTYSTREIVEHGGGVGVIALTENNEICLVRQYRHPYGEIIYEIPAGKLEKGEEPLTCGKRELSEEAGLTAGIWRELGRVYPSPGYCGETIYLFLAKGIKKGDSHPDEGEFVESVSVPLDTAVKMVMNGEITDSKTQIAILKTAELIKGEKV